MIDNIDDLECGIEIDCLIAKHVFSLRDDTIDRMRSARVANPWDSTFVNSPLPRYSIDISAAFTIVEHFCSLNASVKYQKYTFSLQYGTILPDDDEVWLFNIANGIAGCQYRGITAPIAICKAALRMVEIEQTWATGQ